MRKDPCNENMSNTQQCCALFPWITPTRRFPARVARIRRDDGQEPSSSYCGVSAGAEDIGTTRTGQGDPSRTAAQTEGSSRRLSQER